MGDIEGDNSGGSMTKTTDFEGSPISYRDLGRGETLMLVHGFGEAGDIWDMQTDSLSAECRLLIPDLTGSGSSPLPEDASPGLEDHARSLLRILDEEAVETCTMIGHSMGGYIALAFAEAFPERLKALGLFHSTATPDGEEKRTHRLRAIDFMERHGVDAFLREAIPNLYAESFRTAHPDVVAEHWEKSRLNLGVRALVSYYRAMMDRPDRRGVLKTLGKPVLMVMGEEDKAVLLHDVLTQCALPEECHMHVWPGVAHMGMREVPQKTTRVLSDFMRHVNL